MTKLQKIWLWVGLGMFMVIEIGFLGIVTSFFSRKYFPLFRVSYINGHLEWLGYLMAILELGGIFTAALLSTRSKSINVKMVSGFLWIIFAFLLYMVVSFMFLSPEIL